MSSTLSGFNVSEQLELEATTMRLALFHFVFKEALTSTGCSVSALNVVGIHAYIYDSDDLRVNFDALVNHLMTHSIVRRDLVLLFESFDLLQESMKPVVEALQASPATENIELMLAYDEREECQCRAVGVDPVTLEPNGASSVVSLALSQC